MRNSKRSLRQKRRLIYSSIKKWHDFNDLSENKDEKLARSCPSSQLYNQLWSHRRLTKSLAVVSA